MLDELHAASDMTILLDDGLMSRATSYTHTLDNDPKTIWTTYLETLIQGGISMVGRLEGDSCPIVCRVGDRPHGHNEATNEKDLPPSHIKYRVLLVYG
jgi:hypothetical protein